MSVRSLMPAFAVTLAMLSLARLGWTADYRVQPQPVAVA